MLFKLGANKANYLYQQLLMLTVTQASNKKSGAVLAKRSLAW